MAKLDTKHFKAHTIGSSADGHANKWEFTCKECGKVFNPVTSLFRFHTIACPRCDVQEKIDYNQWVE